jgi:hypothetical protein
MPTVRREVDRAENAGIVTTEKVGPTRLVRANVVHPLHDAVRRIILATYGPPPVIADEFQGIDGVEAVLLFGSCCPVSRRAGTRPERHRRACHRQRRPGRCG